MSHRNSIEFRSINDEPFTQENNCDKICNVAPKWMYCPVGSAFGGNNICSTFRSSNRNINLTRPKIDYFASHVEDLINYENMIAQGLFNEICNENIEKLSEKDQMTIWQLLKSVVSTDTCIEEVLSLAESYRDISNSSSTNNPIENGTKNIYSLEPSTFNDFETSIIDRIIESDFEGAMNDCFAAGRPVDALLISNCGGIDLRSKAENFILGSSDSFLLNLAVSLSRNDLYEFTSTAPANEWLRMLRVISKHSAKESEHHLYKKLATRLVGENMYNPALFAAILALDFELFLEVVLKLTQKDRTLRAQELIDFFKIIRIIEALKPNSIKSIANYSTKIAVFEIVSKLAYLLSSAGFKADFVTNLLDKDFYDSHMKTKNPLIDTFFDSMGTSNPSNNVILSRDLAPATVQLSESNVKHLPQQILSSSSFGYIPTKPQFFSNNISCSPSPSLNRNYNDVPVLIPKFSKHSPQLCSQGFQKKINIIKYFIHLDIKLEDAALALKSLSNAIDTKTLPVFRGINSFFYVSLDFKCSCR